MSGNKRNQRAGKGQKFRRYGDYVLIAECFEQRIETKPHEAIRIHLICPVVHGAKKAAGFAKPRSRADPEVAVFELNERPELPQRIPETPQNMQIVAVTIDFDQVRSCLQALRSFVTGRYTNAVADQLLPRRLALGGSATVALSHPAAPADLVNFAAGLRTIRQRDVGDFHARVAIVTGMQTVQKCGHRFETDKPRNRGAFEFDRAPPRSTRRGSRRHRKSHRRGDLSNRAAKCRNAYSPFT